MSTWKTNLAGCVMFCVISASGCAATPPVCQDPVVVEETTTREAPAAQVIVLRMTLKRGEEVLSRPEAKILSGRHATFSYGEGVELMLHPVTEATGVRVQGTLTQPAETTKIDVLLEGDSPWQQQLQDGRSLKLIATVES